MPFRVSFAQTVLLLAFSCAGCRNTWHEPQGLPVLYSQYLAWKVPAAASSTPDCGAAERLKLAGSLASAAGRAERTGSAESVDLYFQAALTAWHAAAQASPGSEESRLASETYGTSVARLAATARDYGRIAPGAGLIVNSGGTPICVPFVLHGLPWRIEDVQALYPVGDFRTKLISRRHRSDGWGVPLVVERRLSAEVRPEEEFLVPGVTFAATALLRPNPATGQAIFELYDPLRSDGCEPPLPGPMAADITAPFALRIADSPEEVSSWLSFFGRDVPAQEGLFLLEPYQRGKIPVVLVHGILSNPVAMMDLANDLRAAPGFATHFQLWGFRYLTEKPFLFSAALLRRRLYQIAATVDPEMEDPALYQTVLIGHSMGGLISELQASSSEDRLWNAAANRPLDCIVTTEETRQEMRELFFFAPQPSVRRVISLAAPHQGSSWAYRPIGRLGNLLAAVDEDRETRHQQLLRDNPGAFSEEIANGVPSSIDMLKPSSQMLQAIQSLPASPYVKFHTVFGFGRPRLLDGPGDGVVTISSALSTRAVSQVGVDATHSKIHRKLETAEEIVRILNEHLTEYATSIESTECQ